MSDQSTTTLRKARDQASEARLLLAGRFPKIEASLDAEIDRLQRIIDEIERSNRQERAGEGMEEAMKIWEEAVKIFYTFAWMQDNGVLYVFGDACFDLPKEAARPPDGMTALGRLRISWAVTP